MCERWIIKITFAVQTHYQQIILVFFFSTISGHILNVSQCNRTSGHQRSLVSVLRYQYQYQYP